MKSKFKKWYLYSAVAFILVAAAVFFAVYGVGAQAFNYKKKAPNKVLDFNYAAYDISSREWVTVTDDMVDHKLADLLSKSTGVSTTLSTKVAEKYDIVALCYYGYYTDEGGNKVVVTSNTLLNPTSPTKLQLSSANSLFDLFGRDVLKEGLNIANYSYNYFATGLVADGDTMYVTYKKGDTETVNEEIVLGADTDAEYGEGFSEALKKNPIGSAIATLTCGDNTYTGLKVNWVLRTTQKATDTDKAINASGATILATVVRTVDKKADTFYVRILPDGTYFIYNSTTNNEETTLPHADIISLIRACDVNGGSSIDYEKITEPPVSFAEGVNYYTLNSETGKYDKVDTAVVTEPVAGTDYYTEATAKIKYDVTAVIDPTAANQTPAKQGFTSPDYVVPDDSTMKDNDGNDLKGKTLKYEIYPLGYYHVHSDYKTITELSSFTGEDSVKFKEVTVKFKAYSDAASAVKSALTSEHSAEYTAFTEALYAFKLNTEDTEKKTAYETAYENAKALLSDSEGKLTAAVSAYDDLRKALTDYGKEGGEINKEFIDGLTTWMDTEALKCLTSDAKAAVEVEEEGEYRTAVGKIIWEKMLEDASITVPGAAKRSAYRDLMDTYKRTFYEDEKNYYAEYNGNFNAYMVKTMGEDYKAQLREASEKTARELLLIYWLADKYDIDLSDLAVQNYFFEHNFYAYYSYYQSSPESLRHAYAFDSVINSILDDTYNVNSYKDTAAETTGE